MAVAKTATKVPERAVSRAEPPCLHLQATTPAWPEKARTPPHRPRLQPTGVSGLSQDRGWPPCHSPCVHLHHAVPSMTRNHMSQGGLAKPRGPTQQRHLQPRQRRYTPATTCYCSGDPHPALPQGRKPCLMRPATEGCRDEGPHRGDRTRADPTCLCFAPDVSEQDKVLRETSDKI